MGVDTNAYLRANTKIDDVKTVLENHLNVKNVKATFHDTMEASTISFETPDGNSRSMFTTITKTALGPAKWFSMGADEEGQNIMRTLVEVFGGIFIGSDHDPHSTTELHDGLFNPEESGLPYFLRSAILENKINPESDENDLDKLKKYIEDWKKEYENR